MPDEVVTQAEAAATQTETATTGTETVTQEQAETDYRAEAEKWKALSRQNEARATANAEKAKRFDELEEANKTELEKATERTAALEAKAAKAETEALRLRTSIKTGVPEELLYGTTPEEFEKSAEAALAWRGKKAAAAVGGADLGTGGSAPARTYTREQLRDPAFYQANKTDILAAQREGRILT